MQPMLSKESEEQDWDSGDLIFVYELGLRPDVHVNMAELNALMLNKVIIGDADVDHEVRRVRKQNAKVDQAESIKPAETTYAGIHFKELGPDGGPMEEGFNKSKMIAWTDMPEKLQKWAEGKKAGDKDEVRLADIFSPEEMAEILETDALTIQDLNPAFELEVTHVYELQEPEENQEFFDKFFEQGKVTSPEGLRGEWRKLMENYYGQRAEGILSQEIKKAVLESTDVPLPDAFLEKYLDMADASADGKTARERLEEWREDLKWIIIAESIEDEQKIEISEEEMLQYAKSLVRNNLEQAGYTQGLEDEMITKMAYNYLGKDNNGMQVRMGLRDMKALQYLRSRINPSEAEISLDEFDKIQPR